MGVAENAARVLIFSIYLGLKVFYNGRSLVVILSGRTVQAKFFCVQIIIERAVLYLLGLR